MIVLTIAVMPEGITRMVPTMMPVVTMTTTMVTSTTIKDKVMLTGVDAAVIPRMSRRLSVISL